MKALILAAGRGTRLRPLTDRLPKPLVEAGGKPLLHHHLEALSRAGIEEAVINVSHLGKLIRSWLEHYRGPLNIQVSDEGRTPLETGGAMLAAAPLLGREPFIAVNADIVTDFDFARLVQVDLRSDLACLVMTANPDYRDGGDFELGAGRVTGRGSAALTFSGIGLYRPSLLDGASAGCFSIVPWLERAISANRVAGLGHAGHWFDTGTRERLSRAREWCEKRSV